MLLLLIYKNYILTIILVFLYFTITVYVFYNLKYIIRTISTRSEGTTLLIVHMSTNHLYSLYTWVQKN